jgi:hypothetical protein
MYLIALSAFSCASDSMEDADFQGPMESKLGVLMANFLLAIDSSATKISDDCSGIKRRCFEAHSPAEEIINQIIETARTRTLAYIEALKEDFRHHIPRIWWEDLNPLLTGSQALVLALPTTLERPAPLKRVDDDTSAFDMSSGATGFSCVHSPKTPDLTPEAEKKRTILIHKAAARKFMVLQDCPAASIPQLLPLIKGLIEKEEVGNFSIFPEKTRETAEKNYKNTMEYINTLDLLRKRILGKFT